MNTMLKMEFGMNKQEATQVDLVTKADRRIDVAGTGFIALDYIYPGEGRQPLTALGGSCGNVLWSLATLGSTVAPIANFAYDHVGWILRTGLFSAGADVRSVFLSPEGASPVIAQINDAETGKHTFSFTCPETGRPYPRYQGITNEQVSQVPDEVWNARVFYTDRLSDQILDCMWRIRNAGGLAVFEPSSIGEKNLFMSALDVASIVKISDDRITDLIFKTLSVSDVTTILTRGAQGLDIIRNGETIRLEAFAHPDPVDTSGSGDMVSVGLIRELLKESHRSGITMSAIASGLRTGQRLAAMNCSFAGARGIYSHMRKEDIVRFIDMDEGQFKAEWLSTVGPGGPD